MGKIAFLFSGQGDQFPGMGKQWQEQYPKAKEVFDFCENIRPGTMEQCFFGSQEELQETKNTQPCLFATELAAAEVLLSKGIIPDAVAGFSLGEVVAATVAGLVEKETGFRLVIRRGELMQEDAQKADTSMMAVVKLSEEDVVEACKKFSQVYPVNFNCPGQITVSGITEEMKEFSKVVRELGGRAIPLKVKGGFHSPFMEYAAGEFAKELEKVSLNTPKIPLYSNLTAQLYQEEFVSTLSKQICNPVQWEKIIGNMISAGIDTFVEIGPGNTLTNMMGKIDTGVKAVSCSDMEKLLESDFLRG